MDEEPREASPPRVGAARDATRTLIACGIAWLLVGVVGEEQAATMSDALAPAIVIGVSAVFAFLGKKLRNDGSKLGKVV